MANLRTRNPLAADTNPPSTQPVSHERPDGAVPPTPAGTTKKGIGPLQRAYATVASSAAPDPPPGPILRG